MRGLIDRQVSACLGRREFMALAGLTTLALGRSEKAFATKGDTSDAAATIDRERAAAASERKGLMLVFFASWCPLCRVLDRLLDHPQTQRIVGARYRILRMRVLERDTRLRAQELAGADEMYARYGSAQNGVPLFLFMDQSGRVLVTSISAMTSENIGFPVEASELDWFDTMLTIAIPGISAQDRAAMRGVCTGLWRR